MNLDSTVAKINMKDLKLQSAVDDIVTNFVNTSK
jgi:hypothetical protein